ncbi:MAG: Uma2 family endonuclease [Desulfamplus sp.]|nr:Uma2 family endonuclease [Desulfamplus sp.]
MEQMIAKNDKRKILFYDDFYYSGKNYEAEKLANYVTEKEYWEKYYEYSDVIYEWNNGVLEEKTVSDSETLDICRWFLNLLERYLEVNPIATMVLFEFGFKMSIHGKIKIRKPDIGIVLHENKVSLKKIDRSYKGTFDICVECISDLTKEEIDRDLVDKKYEYSNAGVKEYYIFDKKNGNTSFYALSQKGSYKKIKSVGGIIKSSVLKGLQFRIEDLYNRPSLIKMAEDEVYKNFIYTEYQQQKERAEQERIEKEKERQIAKQERQRADNEKQRAEQEKIEKEKAKQIAKQERQRADNEKQRAEQERIEKEKAIQIAKQEKQRADMLEAKLKKLSNNLIV